MKPLKPQARTELLYKLGRADVRRQILLVTPEIFVGLADDIIKLAKLQNVSLMYDEVGMFKQAGTSRVRAGRRMPAVMRSVVGMTATAVSDDFAALYAQFLCIDGGKTFGTSQEAFLAAYFNPPPPYREHAPWTIMADGAERLAKAIEPSTAMLVDRKSELPTLNYHRIWFDLEPETREAYEDMAAYGILLDSRGEVMAEAQNAGVQNIIMRSITSGAIYNDAGYIELSNERVNLTAGLVDEVLTSDRDRVIVTYELRADRDRFLDLARDDEHFPAVTTMNDKCWKQTWQERGGVLLMHPKSGGHGLQLEAMCNKVIWMALPWSRDVFDQLIGRVWRFGQTQEVDCYYVSATNTVDTHIWARLEDKAMFEILLRQHIQHFVNCADHRHRKA